MTTDSDDASLAARRTWRPSALGIRRSVITTSNVSRRRVSMAVSPPSATVTSKCCFSSEIARRSRMLFSSSTTSTRASLMEFAAPSLARRCPRAIASRLRRRDARQAEREGRPATRGATHVDVSAVLLDHPIDHGEAEAAPFRLGRVEGLEDVREVRFGDAGAGVPDPDLHAAGASLALEHAAAHAELAPRRHRLHRVEAQVPDGLA